MHHPKRHRSGVDPAASGARLRLCPKWSFFFSWHASATRKLEAEPKKGRVDESVTLKRCMPETTSAGRP